VLTIRIANKDDISTAALFAEKSKNHEHGTAIKKQRIIIMFPKERKRT